MSTENVLPAHASPAFPPVLTPQPHHSRSLSSSFKLDDRGDGENPPPALISPAFTPPATPGNDTDAADRPAKSVPVDTAESTEPAPKLMQKLPEVWCEVRARIPTTNGTEMYLYLYKNNSDSKEHLAIVFGPHIRSKSLDAPRTNETEKDRMIRGAYVGRLHPGRTTSRVEQLRAEHGVRPQASQRTASTASTVAESESEAAPTTAENLAQASQEATPPPEPASEDIPMVRIHSECYTGETVWSARCDCGEQLDEAARLMSLPTTHAGGAIIYLRQEGRGIGLGEKLKAYNLQDLGHDTYEANLLLRHPADARTYGLATAMLMDLGLDGERGIRLLTNNPDKVRAVEGPNREVRVRERCAMVPLAWKTGGESGIKSEEVEKYLSTKIEKFKHMIG